LSKDAHGHGEQNREAKVGHPTAVSHRKLQFDLTPAHADAPVRFKN
jgi:hypothetical protein